MNAAEKSVHEQVLAFFNRKDVRNTLEHVGDAVGGFQQIKVVGGALRELVLHALASTVPIIPDLDAAILAEIDTATLSARLGEHQCSQNTFGGVRWVGPYGIEVDLWSARSWSLGLGQETKREYSAHDLLKMLDFTVNTGVYSPASSQVNVSTIVEAVLSRSIELNNSLVLPHALQLARVLKLERRLRPLGFELGFRLERYLVSVMRSLDDQELQHSRNYFMRKLKTDPNALAYFDARVRELRPSAKSILSR